jgi:hypothetical protein
VIERISVVSDPAEPDWRFRLVLEDTVLGEGFFDADTGWDVGDRPRGWTFRYVEDGARDAAAAAAAEMVVAARTGAASDS